MSTVRDLDDPRRRRFHAAGLLVLWLLSHGPARAGQPAAGGDRTAVSVTFERRQLPEVEAMQSWFLLRGEPLEVLAVEKGPAEVVVIRDPKVQPHLDLLAKSFAAAARASQERRRAAAERRGAGRVAALDDERWNVLILQRDREGFLEAGREIFRNRRGAPPDHELVAIHDALRRTCRLGEGVSVRFLSPQAAPVSHTVEQMNIFNLTQSFPAERKGFLTLVEAAPTLRFVTRFADAAWLIGRELHDRGRRRAVLMLVEAGSWDESLHRTAMVRSTLERLQVPVFAWSFGPGVMSGKWDARLISETSESLDEERSPARFESACADLRREIEAQRIVWLAGRHPAAVITLGADAEGIRLAGSRPVREEAR